MFTQALHDAGVPKGVYNLVNGDGPTVGQAISSHPDIDMVSFTGSTRAGILVAKAGADTVKRVHQELGGKSPNIILPDFDLAAVIPAGVLRSFTNTGHCQAPTRMLVHRSQASEAIKLAKITANAVVVGPPRDANTRLGPLVSSSPVRQSSEADRSGPQGGRDVCCRRAGSAGGTELRLLRTPNRFCGCHFLDDHCTRGIFGPVLSMLFYDTEDEAVSIANDTMYGLAGYVTSGDLENAKRVGRKLRAGRIYLNGAPHGKLQDVEAPFGGYKQSGNGREAGVFGLEDFLEIKALIGHEPPQAVV